jgi:hypothetical protein
MSMFVCVSEYWRGNALGGKFSEIDRRLSPDDLKAWGLQRLSISTMDRDRGGSFATSVSSPPISTVSSFKDHVYPVDEMPGSPGEWKKLAMRHKLAGGSIFDLDKYASASKISDKQFLCLRALWITNQAKFLANDDNRRTWLRDAHYLEARHLLPSLPSWQAYLDSSGVSGEEVLQKGFS